MLKRAVIYIRVSTKEQTDNLSLEFQELRCREYCERHVIEVVRVLEDGGKSAKTLNRPSFRELMSYSIDKRSNIDTVVVYDTNRFSREATDFNVARAELRRYGVLLRSVTMPIDETPLGNWMATMSAANGQLDNETKGVQTVERMKAALAKGRWTHQPPIGYVKPPGRARRRKNAAIALSEGPSLAHDPERAAAVRMAFEMAASGQYSKVEIRDRINATGFSTRHGRKLSLQTLDKILENPIYCGWMVIRNWSVREKGDFEPIISEELFDRVNPKKSVGNGPIRSHQRDNADFPLRRFITCAGCGKKISGSWSTSRKKQKYAYYACPRCRGTGMPKEQLEGRFKALLARYKPKAGAVRLFTEIVRDLYRERQAHSVRTAAKLSERVEVLKRKKDALADALIDGKLDDATYREQEARRRKEALEAEQALASCAGTPQDLEKVLRFAEGFLDKCPQMWSAMNLRQKQTFQSAIFPSGVTYDGKRLRTAEIPMIFNVIAVSKPRKSGVASPGGFEPPLPP